MGDKGAPDGAGQDSFWIYGVGILFACACITKFFKWWTFWATNMIHQYEMAFSASVISFCLYFWTSKRWEVAKLKRKRELAILSNAMDAVYCGETDARESVFIKTKQRSMHTQVIGTTNAGKTESVILPWAIQDIEQGRGLILIDGKSDRSLLDKLWTYAVKNGREQDFRLFSLAGIDESFQFNPLIGGATEEVAERVFNSFDFENPHYRSVQYEVFSQFLRVFEALKEIPTFLKLHQGISQPAKLYALMRDCPNDAIKQWLKNFIEIPASDRIERTSGLTAAISHFAFGKTAILFNTETPSIQIEKAFEKNLIVYFQLPVLLTPFLGKASGKMILQCLQAAVANRHRGKDRSFNFFSVFLDDFTEYLYPGFVSVLNKSRSANVGVVFAHQALGDLKTLGDPIANSILTNSNLKVFMRGNEPESAEYFSKVIGTSKTVKYTERTKKAMFAQASTGDASAREVDEFIVHPNVFKSELGVGEAVMVIPHEAGSKTVRIKFKKYDDLPALLIPIQEKKIANQLPEPPQIKQPKEEK
jgi:type IV secretory pathway TraG/TraD family ATPase VirD4